MPRSSSSIRGLLLYFGSVEGTRAAALPVVWRGVPFKSGGVAVTNFVAAVRAMCRAPRPTEPPCCAAQRAQLPTARACATCGRRFTNAKSKDASPVDVLHAILASDIDGWSDATPRWFESPESGDVEAENGRWAFYEALPDNCRVVVVLHAEALFSPHATPQPTLVLSEQTRIADSSLK